MTKYMKHDFAFFRTQFSGILPASAIDAISLVSLLFFFFLDLFPQLRISKHTHNWSFSVFFALIYDLGVFFRLLMEHFRMCIPPYRVSGINIMRETRDEL